MGGYITFVLCIVALAFCGEVFSSCVHDKFDCGGGHCIPVNWRCDNETDCKNGADERDCNMYSCDHDTQFECDNGACIPLRWRCDGNSECQKGEDEMNCIAPTSTMPPQVTSDLPTVTPDLSTLTPVVSSQMSVTSTMGSVTTNMPKANATTQLPPGVKDPNCDDFQSNCHILVNEIDICSDGPVAELLCASTCHMCNGVSGGGYPTKAPTSPTSPTTPTTTLPRSTHEPYTTPQGRPDGSGALCEDLEDNCPTLVTAVNICSNQEKAMFLCPKTCKLCKGPSTAAPMGSSASTVPGATTRSIGIAIVGK